MFKPKLFDENDYRDFVKIAKEKKSEKEVHAFFHYVLTQYGSHNVNFIERLGEAIQMDGDLPDRVKRGYQLFIEPTKQKKTEDAIKPPTKLKWSGQKNQLYEVLRKLKEDGFILNSYNELADFLIQCVIPFQNTSKETIEKELKKKKPLPKNKRVNISALSNSK